MQRRWQIGCGLAIILFLTHPWLFGLYGRVLENRFQHEVKPGMTKAQLVQLWSESGSAPPPWYDDYIFVDWETFCFESGKQFQVKFDADMRVKSWTERPWVIGC